MDAVYTEGPPPHELQLAWFCGDEHLPDAGGMLDQDYRLMVRMRATRNIYRVMDKMKNLEGSQIHILSTSERKLIRLLREGGFI